MSKITRDIPGESRKEQIARINGSVAAQGKALITKMRHERRHNRGHRTSLAERGSFIRDMSKEPQQIALERKMGKK